MEQNCCFFSIFYYYTPKLPWFPPTSPRPPARRCPVSSLETAFSLELLSLFSPLFCLSARRCCFGETSSLQLLQGSRFLLQLSCGVTYFLLLKVEEVCMTLKMVGPFFNFLNADTRIWRIRDTSCWNTVNYRFEDGEFSTWGTKSQKLRGTGRHSVFFPALFNIFEGFNLILSIAPSFFIPYLPFVFLQWPVDSEGRFMKKKEAERLLEAKRIQGPRQLINVLLVSHQLKSTFLQARRRSSVLFECRPARPVKYWNDVSYLLF